ncbi:MAG: hypothetical protein IH802_05260 [Nitrospinae bacterium]|nr:hypothetical protein [Nitrospinota bacterium]
MTKHKIRGFVGVKSNDGHDAAIYRIRTWVRDRYADALSRRKEVLDPVTGRRDEKEDSAFGSVTRAVRGAAHAAR